MKSNVPWSIKGIDPDARVVAKKAARAAGMTLGEWLNHQIMETDDGDTGDTASEGSAENVQRLPTNVVTVDQLREVVYSLNRMNERLKSSERDSIQAFSGINQGLTSVLDRLKRVEEQRDTAASPETSSAPPASGSGESSRKYIDSFIALEGALKTMVEQLETTRDETLTRVSATEEAIGKLDTRIAHIDAQGAAALSRMHEHVDQVSEQLRKTEATARALMLEARAAAKSDDEEFVERTSNKLRILGTEIKRSGDQIQSLEGHIQKLSERIEGAEQRSAEGINMLTDRLTTLSTELSDFDREQAEVTRTAHAAIEETTQTAHSRMNDLQGSFEKMITRLEGVVDGEQAYREMVAAKPEADEPDADQPEEAEAPLQQAMQEAEKELPGEDDFDEVFGDTLEDQPVTDDANEDTTEETDPLPLLEDTADADLIAPEGDEDSEAPKLTAKQKVILAARARRKRLEREAKIRTESDAPDEAILDDDDSGDDDAPVSAVERISQLREKYANGGRRLPIMIGVIAAFAIVAILGWFVLQGNQSSAISALDNNDGAATAEAPELTAAEQFDRWQTLSATATSDEDKSRALMVLRRAAGRDYPPAQYALGEIYRTGASGDQNPTMARNWFQAAAEGGNVDAMHKLGSMYAQGIGGPANESNAISWFEQASTYGYVDSIYNLALIYDPGIDLGTGSTQEKDADKAYYWYAIAAKLGDQEANSDAMKVGLTISPESRRSLDTQVEGWQPRAPIPTAN